MLRKLYWWFAFLGVMTLSASFISGFRYAAEAPIDNLYFNVVIYAAFIIVHIIMTMPIFKRMAYGNPQGTIIERRIYVMISVVTWLLVFWLHKPISGPVLTLPDWLQFLGLCAVLLSLMAFFEFATFDMIAALLGAKDELSHTVGAETPLMQEGPYSTVRHPMYRAFFCLAAASLLVHPHAGQLLFAVMVTGSFVLFIPFEERQLIKARGDQYRDYMRAVPYRVFRGIW